jgi:hypothetical protein
MIVGFLVIFGIMLYDFFLFYRTMDYLKKLNQNEIFETDVPDEHDRIFLIKQKYIMYLEWLDRNNSMKSTAWSKNRKNLMSDPKPVLSTNNLNWYKYEHSLTATSTDDKISSYSKSSTIDNQYRQLPQITLGKSKSNKKNKQAPPPTAVAITVPESTQIVFAKGPKLEKKALNYSISRRMYSNSRPIEQNPTSENQRGVKFEFQTCSTESAFQTKNEQQILKPILKRNLNSLTPANMDRLKKITTTTATPISSTPVPIVLSQTQSVLQKNSAKHVARLPLLSDSIKSRQCAGCSDDFYAVINDLECSNLV